LNTYSFTIQYDGISCGHNPSHPRTNPARRARARAAASGLLEPRWPSEGTASHAGAAPGRAVGTQATPRTRGAQPRCAPGEAVAGPCEGAPSHRTGRAKPGSCARTSRAGRPVSRRAGNAGSPPRRATRLAGRAHHAGRPVSRHASHCAAGWVAERGSPSAGKSRAERVEGEGVGEGHCIS
jgi:hypothetical protein